MILLDGTIVSVATPTLVRSLHADVNAVVWVTSAYLLAFAVPLLVTGRLGDRFGPKRVYLIGMVIFVLASLACGLAGSVQALIAARIVQGLGGALMSPQTMSVITRIFPADRRGTAMGIWGSVAGLAGVGGPVLGGLLIGPLGWQAVFFVNLPIGLFGLLLAWRVVPELPTHMHRFDLVGVVLSAAAMLCLTYAIHEGPGHHTAAHRRAQRHRQRHRLDLGLRDRQQRPAIHRRRRRVRRVQHHARPRCRGRRRGVGAVMQSRLAAEPGHATAMGQSLLFFVAMLAIALLAAIALRTPTDPSR